MSELWDKGIAIRREVLGDEYVDQALANSDGFGADLQKIVTEVCWGTIWARDGLPRKTRSLINVAILSALNRMHEVKTHIRGALNNGCTIGEIEEVILQTAIYCGVPAAIDAMRVARQAVAEMKKGLIDSA